MRLGLTQNLRAEQRLIQSPQMIQAMQILQTPMMELKDQIEQELQENVFLEIKDAGEEADGLRTIADESPADDSAAPSLDDKLERQFTSELEQLELRTERMPQRVSSDGAAEESERRMEALYNTPDHDESLHDYLLEQVRIAGVSDELYPVVEHVVYSLDEDGRLHETAEQIARDLIVPVALAEEAIAFVRRLDPPGVAAKDLRDALLMQLERMSYVRPLTRTLIERHLDDLALNKLPKIAKETGSTIHDIQESWEFIRYHLNPHPGRTFSPSRNAVVVPDVIVEETEGRFEVRTERGTIPELGISPIYRKLLKEARSDPKIYEYLRRKIEAAKWFIEAVHQRQNTIHRIASEIVKRQEGFLREGVHALKPMKMQDVADAVHVHISTVSRAISGKHIQTPQGIFDMKRFFSGGTVTDSGSMVSQQAVKERLREIVDGETKGNPLSDDQLVEELARNGIHIARRTVTKYRKALGIESSSRRRVF
jgi:RNA polymerase sigma-54 factor